VRLWGALDIQDIPLGQTAMTQAEYW